MPAEESRRPMHMPFLLVLQAVLIVLFGFFVEYDSPALPTDRQNSHHGAGNNIGNHTNHDDQGHHAASDVNNLGHYYPSNYFILGC